LSSYSFLLLANVPSIPAYDIVIGAKGISRRPAPLKRRKTGSLEMTENWQHSRISDEDECFADAQHGKGLINQKYQLCFFSNSSNQALVFNPP
jgi:hypothetical protein